MLTKTKSILITGKRLKSRMQLSSLPLIASNSNIELVSSQKLLGVIIDVDLNFKEHINKLSKNLSKKIGLLRKIRRYLPLLERKLFYNAVVKPVMMYGSSIWSGCSRNDLLRIFKLQRAARVILGTDISSRSMANFNKLNWIPFYDGVKINKCTLVYKSLHDQAPQYIKNLSKTNNEINGRQTRHGEYNLVCPKYNYATEGGKSVTVSSIKIWNSLPKDIKTKSSINSFKFALKNYFLDSYKDIDRFELLL
jgi:hypothetical protein